MLPWPSAVSRCKTNFETLLVAMLTSLDVTLQHGYVLHGFVADVTLQVLLEQIFCFTRINLQSTIPLQLCKGIRHVNEERGSEGVPVFLVLQCW